MALCAPARGLGGHQRGGGGGTTNPTKRGFPPPPPLRFPPKNRFLILSPTPFPRFGSGADFYVVAVGSHTKRCVASALTKNCFINLPMFVRGNGFGGNVVFSKKFPAAEITAYLYINTVTKNHIKKMHCKNGKHSLPFNFNDSIISREKS